MSWHERSIRIVFRRLIRLDLWMETGRNYVRGWLVDLPIAKTEQSLRFRHPDLRSQRFSPLLILERANHRRILSLWREN